MRPTIEKNASTNNVVYPKSIYVTITSPMTDNDIADNSGLLRHEERRDDINQFMTSSAKLLR